MKALSPSPIFEGEVSLRSGLASLTTQKLPGQFLAPSQIFMGEVSLRSGLASLTTQKLPRQFLAPSQIFMGEVPPCASSKESATPSAGLLRFSLPPSLHSVGIHFPNPQRPVNCSFYIFCKGGKGYKKMCRIFYNPDFHGIYIIVGENKCLESKNIPRGKSSRSQTIFFSAKSWRKTRKSVADFWRFFST